jgi:hypothetical protein
MDLSPSSEASSCAITQEFSNFYETQRFNTYPQPDQSTTLSCLSKIHFNNKLLIRLNKLNWKNGR